MQGAGCWVRRRRVPGDQADHQQTRGRIDRRQAKVTQAGATQVCHLRKATLPSSSLRVSAGHTAGPGPQRLQEAGPGFQGSVFAFSSRRPFASILPAVSERFPHRPRPLRLWSCFRIHILLSQHSVSARTYLRAQTRPVLHLLRDRGYSSLSSPAHPPARLLQSSVSTPTSCSSSHPRRGPQRAPRSVNQLPENQSLPFSHLWAGLSSHLEVDWGNEVQRLRPQPPAPPRCRSCSCSHPVFQ